MKSKLYCILLISLLFLATACNKNASAANQSTEVIQTELPNQDPESTGEVDIQQIESSEQEIEPIDEDFYPAEDNPDVDRDSEIESLLARAKTHKTKESLQKTFTDDAIKVDDDLNKSLIEFIKDYRKTRSAIQCKELKGTIDTDFYFDNSCEGLPRKYTNVIYITKDEADFTDSKQGEKTRVKGLNNDNYYNYSFISFETVIGYIKDNQVIYLENEVYERNVYWVISDGSKHYIYGDYSISDLYIRESDVPLILETLKTSEMTEEGYLLNFNNNTITAIYRSQKQAEFSLDHFSLEKGKGLKHGVSARYSFVDDPDAVGVSKYRKYEGELYLFAGNKEIKPVLNIVHELEESYGAKIKLLNCRSDADNIKVEYEVQLYDQKAAGFGTVEITYEIGGNPYKGYVYNVKDYKSDITGYFKHTDDNDPTNMVPSMDGDVTVNVDFPLEKFNKIADQVLSFRT